MVGDVHGQAAGKPLTTPTLRLSLRTAYPLPPTAYAPYACSAPSIRVAAGAPRTNAM